MRINGLQKLTLLDFPGKTACTVFTAGCNLRCPFCHNAALVTHVDPDAYMEEDEFFAFLKKRKGLLDGVAITGGEPTLEPDLLDFMRRVRDQGFGVKLDTNGTRPDVLRRVLDEGLADLVAMDIKNSPQKYALTAGVGNFPMERVNESISLLMSGSTPFEFRTTVVDGLHDPEDLAAIGRWIAGEEPYFLQNFKDSGDLIDPSMRGKTPEQMAECLAAVKPYLPNAELRGI